MEITKETYLEVYAILNLMSSEQMEKIPENISWESFFKEKLGNNLAIK